MIYTAFKALLEEGYLKDAHFFRILRLTGHELNEEFEMLVKQDRINSMNFNVRDGLLSYMLFITRLASALYSAILRSDSP